MTRSSEQFAAEPLHTRSAFLATGGPVQGGAAVPAQRGCEAERSTRDGVVARKILARVKQFGVGRVSKV